MKRATTAAFVAGVMVFVFSNPANASNYCADILDGFGAEMSKIADAYDRMKTDQEVCDFGRNTDIPTHKRILSTVQEIRSRCKFGTAEVNFAQETLQKTINRTDEVCRKAADSRRRQ